MEDEKLKKRLATIGATVLIAGVLVSGYVDFQNIREAEKYFPKPSALEISAKEDTAKYDLIGDSLKIIPYTEREK